MKTLTAQDMIEILSKIDPNLEVAIKHVNPDYTEESWTLQGTVCTLVESDCIQVKDNQIIIDIS